MSINLVGYKSKKQRGIIRFLVLLIIFNYLIAIPVLSQGLTSIQPSTPINNRITNVPIGIGGLTSLAPITTTPFTTNIIQKAVNAAIDGHTISINPGTYRENVIINKNLSILGSGASNTIVDGNNFGPVFTINPGVTVTLSGMKITNGNGTIIIGYSTSCGGGIINHGILNLDNIVITGNTAGNGGGIFNDRGIVNMKSGSSISGNIANVKGGGIYNGHNGVVNLKSGSSVYGNIARSGSGGGIYTERSDGVNFMNSAGTIITPYDPNKNDYLSFFPTNMGRNMPNNVSNGVNEVYI